jgi:hypothetical protein
MTRAVNAAVASAPITASRTARAPFRGIIASTPDRDDNREIWHMRAGGSEPVKDINKAIAEANPS